MGVRPFWNFGKRTVPFHVVTCWRHQAMMTSLLFIQNVSNAQYALIWRLKKWTVVSDSYPVAIYVFLGWKKTGVRLRGARCGMGRDDTHDTLRAPQPNPESSLTPKTHKQSGISLNLRTGPTGHATLFNQWEGALVFINKQIKTSLLWSNIFKTADGVGQNQSSFRGSQAYF